MADEWGVDGAWRKPSAQDHQVLAIHPPLLWISYPDSGFPLGLADCGLRSRFSGRA